MFPEGFHKDYYSQEIEEIKEGKFTIGIGDDAIPARGDTKAVLGYIYEKRNELETEVLYDHEGDAFSDRKKFTLTSEEIKDISARIERNISEQKAWDIVEKVFLNVAFGMTIWEKQ